MPEARKLRRATLAEATARSQPTDATSECASVTSQEEPPSRRSGLDARRLVRPTDRRLAELVAADAGVNWDALRASVGAWSKVASADNRDFAVYTARARSGGAHFVAAIGTVCASAAEVRAVLRPPSSEAYTAAMAELYGQEFIFGSIVHRCAAESAEAGTLEGLEPASASARRRIADVTVKTATFEKQHAFARSEAWCYADGVYPLADGKGFAVVMAPLEPDDVFAGKTSAAVSELGGMHASYAAVPSEDARLVRVSFYGFFKPSRLAARAGIGRSARRSASSRAIAVRLMRMAEATSRLAVIVRRRRLGAQVYANHNAFRPANARCVCCTHKFSALLGRKKKKKCHLCGYFVCESPCSTKYEMERSPFGGRRVFTVRVCEHCMERVDSANYANLPADGACAPTIQPRAPGGESSAAKLARLLRDTLVAAPRDKKSAVKSVILDLISDDGGREEAAGAAAARQRALTVDSPEDEYLEALDTRLRVKELPAEQCALANTHSRTYPLAYDAREGVPMHPLPANEAARLSAVSRHRLSEVRNLPELELICTLASRELRCSIGFVTIVGRDATFIIATNSETMRDKVVPREQSLCSYTIMSDKPTLVHHPEADIRFSRQNVVVHGSLRFYFAFPLFAPDKRSVVGAVCCAHDQSLTVDAAQYATLAKLSDSATRLLAARLKDDDDSWAALGEDARAIERGL